jgi:hypothetical protein
MEFFDPLGRNSSKFAVPQPLLGDNQIGISRQIFPDPFFDLEKILV